MPTRRLRVFQGEAAASTPDHGRRADIQGLRALAILLVVLFHTGLLLPGGFIGVDVFFAISGFVIAGSLVGELDRSDRISLAGFYGRRAKRLLPGLALMVACIVPLATLLGPAASQRTGSITGVFASVFAANVYLASLPTGYFDASTALNPLLHTWTLAVEEQFYLVFPLLLLAGRRLGRRGSGWRVSRGTVALIAGLTVISFLWSHHLSGGAVTGGVYQPSRAAFYGAAARAWEFGAGALLFAASPLLARLPAVTARILGMIGLGLIAGAALAIDRTSTVGGTAFVPVVGAGLLLAAGTATGTGTSRLLSARLLGWIGDRSYGWYLWHWPLIVFVTALWPGAGWAAPAAGIVSLGPTWLSFRMVENRVRFNPSIRGRRVLALGLVCTAIPLAACGAALAVGHALDATRSLSSWRASQALHADVVRNCDSYTPLARRTGDNCTWTVAHPRGTIVLFGDSNAGHFTEPVVRAGMRAGYDVEVVTSSSCPVVGVHSRRPCLRFAEQTVDTLVRRHPSLVIMAARTDLYLGVEQILPSPASPERVRLWQQELRAVLTRLNRVDIPVVVVHPIPLLTQAPDRCAIVSVLTDACGSSVPRSAAERELAPSDGAENAAVAAAPLSWTLSTDDALCTASRCATMRNGVVLYRNQDHLSVQGALLLTSLFESAIREHARPGNAPQKGP